MESQTAIQESAVMVFIRKCIQLEIIKFLNKPDSHKYYMFYNSEFNLELSVCLYFEGVCHMGGRDQQGGGKLMELL